MTKKEYVTRDIWLIFDFIQQVVDHPEILEAIPNGAELDFIDKDMPSKAKGEARGKKSSAIKLSTCLSLLKVKAVVPIKVC